jgi:hypothetical protein
MSGWGDVSSACGPRRSTEEIQDRVIQAIFAAGQAAGEIRFCGITKGPRKSIAYHFEMKGRHGWEGYTMGREAILELFGGTEDEPPRG